MASTAYSQFNQDAPWLKQLKNKRAITNDKSAEQFTFHEIQRAFNTYWETRDPNRKGSGYKPFKRWEYIWEDVVDQNGYLPTAKDMWTAWEHKKKAISQTSYASTDASNWQAIGPFTHTNTGSWSSGQARINVIMVDPNTASTWYVGAPAGGLWKSTDSGSTWVALTDDLPQIGVSGITIDPNDSNIIYIATGDDDGGDTQSAGVFKSTDGGTTWNATGLNVDNTPTSMNDIYIHPTNSSILWVATNEGVFKSIDAGVSWTNTLSGDIKDIKLKPSDPNTIYAVTSSEFYKSTNAGDSFSQITSGIPTGGGRIVVEVTPANSAYVYLLISKEDNSIQGTYRSTNSGTSFTARNTTTDVLEGTQAWFDLALGVSQTNENEVYVGCLNVWKSTNGGTSFTRINEWNKPTENAYTHADIHMIRTFGNRVFVCSDGGVYSSTNSGSSFTDHTGGIQASQFYKIAVSPTNVNKMVGGLQDNGGHAYNNGNGNWLNYYGADGMDTAIHPTNDSKYYGFTQNGGGLYKSIDSGSSSSGSVNKPGSATGNWVTPIAMNSSGQLYAGYDKLYRLNGSETGWVTLADLGASADQMEIAPSDDTRLYIAVGTALKRSNNSGTSVSDVYTFGKSIKGIGVHSTNPDILWVTTSSNVYRSDDGGSTFTNITSNLPTTDKYVFLNDIVHHAGQAQDPIYVATSIGVYRTVTDGGTWTPFFNNLPTTIVTDLEINTADNSITAATYGRGIWRSSLPNCSTITATQELEVDSNGFEFKTQEGVCTGQSITFKPTVTNGTSPTFSWSGPGGFTSTSPTVTINNLTLSDLGEYIVTIDATGTCGAIDYSFSIDIEEALQPTSQDVTICNNTTASLTASGSTEYKWYDTLTGGTELSTGNAYTTPTLTANKTYYVAGTSAVIATEVVPAPNISTAGDYDRAQGLIFNTNDEITLTSFTMSAVTAGDRLIQVVSQDGTVVASNTINIPAGESLVTVNFVIPKGDGYTLQIPSGTVNMRRTPTGNGVAYPYTSPSNIVSIIGNTANASDYYYFFYNWNFTSKGGRCESVRTPVNVIVNTDNPDLTDGDTTYTINSGVATSFNANDTVLVAVNDNLDLSLPATAFSGTLVWTAPGGATYTTNTVSLTNLQDGGPEDGAWSVAVTFNPDCGTSPQMFNFNVDVDATLSTDENAFKDLQIHPNPTKSFIYVNSSNSLQKATITIADIQGRIILKTDKPELITKNQIKLDLKTLAYGTYFLSIKDGVKVSTRKIVKE